MYRGQASQDRTSHHAESCQLCLHHSPSSSSERARAHPKNRQVPSQTIRSHLQSSPTWCCTRFAPAHARGTRPDAPASPHSHIFQSLRLSLPLRSKAGYYLDLDTTPTPQQRFCAVESSTLKAVDALRRRVRLRPDAADSPCTAAAPFDRLRPDATVRRFRFPDPRFPSSVPQQLPVPTTHPSHDEV